MIVIAVIVIVMIVIAIVMMVMGRPRVMGRSWLMAMVVMAMMIAIVMILTVTIVLHTVACVVEYAVAGVFIYCNNLQCLCVAIILLSNYHIVIYGIASLRCNFSHPYLIRTCMGM